MTLGFDNFATTDGSVELLTGCRFYFSAQGVVDERPILEISGLSVECPPAGNNSSFGSYEGGQKLRQATPTSQKFELCVVKLIASSKLDLFTWYTDCNNESKGQQWDQRRTDSDIWAYDQAGAIQAHWQIQRSYPCKYTGPQFKADDENMANEEICLVHEGVVRMQ